MFITSLTIISSESGATLLWNLQAGYHQSFPITTPIIVANTINVPSSSISTNSPIVLLGFRRRKSSSTDALPTCSITGTVMLDSNPLTASLQQYKNKNLTKKKQNYQVIYYIIKNHTTKLTPL